MSGQLDIFINYINSDVQNIRMKNVNKDDVEAMVEIITKMKQPINLQYYFLTVQSKQFGTHLDYDTCDFKNILKNIEADEMYLQNLFYYNDVLDDAKNSQEIINYLIEDEVFVTFFLKKTV